MKSSRDLCQEAKVFTDAGEWKSSWHWPTTPNGYEDVLTVKAALHSLDCEDEAQEIYGAIEKIKLRYSLALEMTEHIRNHEEEPYL